MYEKLKRHIYNNPMNEAFRPYQDVWGGEVVEQSGRVVAVDGRHDDVQDPTRAVKGLL